MLYFYFYHIFTLFILTFSLSIILALKKLRHFCHLCRCLPALSSEQLLPLSLRSPFAPKKPMLSSHLLARSRYEQAAIAVLPGSLAASRAVAAEIAALIRQRHAEKRPVRPFFPLTAR